MSTTRSVSAETLEKVKKFLEQCIVMPADELSSESNENLLPGDVLHFLTIVNPQDNHLVSFFELINTDLIIKNLFPSAQLSKRQIEFLKACTFIFRRKEGLYTYEHFHVKKVQAEIRINILGIYLWAYYGITFHRYPLPLHNRSGNWVYLKKDLFNIHDINNQVIEDSQIEVIPPRGASACLITINELLPTIGDLAQSFELVPFHTPLPHAETQREENFFNLYQRVQARLLLFAADMQQAMDVIWDKLLAERMEEKEEEDFSVITANQFSYADTVTESKPLNAENELHLSSSEEVPYDDIASYFADVEREQQAFYAVTQEVNFAVNSESPSKKRKYADDFIEANHIISYMNSIPVLRGMFECESDSSVVVIRKNVAPLVNQQGNYIISSLFFNAFMYLSFFYLAKKYNSLVINSATDWVYTNNAPSLPTEGSALRVAIYRILAENSDKVDTSIMASGLLKKIVDLIQCHGISKWDFGRELYLIPLDDFIKIFSSENIHFFMPFLTENNLNQFYKQVECRKQIKKMSTEALLGKLKLTSGGLYIQKIQSTDSQYLDTFFSNNIYRITSATIFIPQMPLKTFKENPWEKKSGMIIFDGQDESINMVGFKRPVYTREIKNNLVFIDFPYSVSNLRSQGGKPSYSARDYIRRLRLIELKRRNHFPDLTRKQFLKNCLVEHAHECKSDFYKNPLNLTSQEIQHLQGKLDKKHISYPVSPSFLYLKEMEAFIEKKLSCYVQETDDIYQCYLKSLNELVMMSLGQHQKSLFSLLMENIDKKFADKLTHLQNNQHQIIANGVPETLLTWTAAVGGIKYAGLPAEMIYAHKEVLLQDVRIRNNKTLDNNFEFTFSFDKYTDNEFVQYELYQRFGNGIGIYANVKNTDGSINVEGIADAWNIHDFLENKYHQLFSFITYDEQGELNVYSKSEFQAAFPGVSLQPKLQQPMPQPQLQQQEPQLPQQTASQIIQQQAERLQNLQQQLNQQQQKNSQEKNQAGSRQWMTCRKRMSGKISKIPDRVKAFINKNDLNSNCTAIDHIILEIQLMLTNKPQASTSTANLKFKVTQKNGQWEWDTAKPISCEKKINKESLCLQPLVSFFPLTSYDVLRSIFKDLLVGIDKNIKTNDAYSLDWIFFINKMVPKQVAAISHPIMPRPSAPLQYSGPVFFQSPVPVNNNTNLFNNPSNFKRKHPSSG